MPAIDLRLIAVFIWIVGCSVATFYLLFRRPSTLPKIGYALVIALLVRLIPALALPRGAGYEMHVFSQAAEMTLAGQSVYLSKIAHPYLPLQLYWFAAAYWLAEHVCSV